MSTSVDDTRIKLALLIGRSTFLGDQWEDNFATRSIDLQQRLQARQYQLRPYLSPPFLNLQTARQLLPTITAYRKLALFVSLLGLGHHQCVGILEGVVTLLKTASEHRYIEFNLEYEFGNPEHNDARQLATITYDHGPHFRSFIYPNTRSVAGFLLMNEGDEMEEEDGIDVL